MLDLEELHEYYKQRGWEWAFVMSDGETRYRVPEAADFQEVLDKANETLYACDEGAWLMLGGLIFVKESADSTARYTVYTRIGDIE